MDLVTFIAIFIFVIALIVVGAWLFKKYMPGDSGAAMNFFGNKEKRIGVVQSTSVDSRRKLILIKRDDVEHLIMTGGPVDVLIETNIQNYKSHIPDKDSDGNRSRMHSKIADPGENVQEN